MSILASARALLLATVKAVAASVMQLTPQARAQCLPGERCGDQGYGFDISDADVLEGNPPASPPEALGCDLQERRSRLLREFTPSAPDRLLKQGHGKPRRDVQGRERGGLCFRNCLSELLSCGAERY